MPIIKKFFKNIKYYPSSIIVNYLMLVDLSILGYYFEYIQKYNEAVIYYLKAIEENNLRAMVLLSFYYFNIEFDIDKVKKYFNIGINDYSYNLLNKINNELLNNNINDIFQLNEFYTLFETKNKNINLIIDELISDNDDKINYNKYLSYKKDLHLSFDYFNSKDIIKAKEYLLKNIKDISYTLLIKFKNELLSKDNIVNIYKFLNLVEIENYNIKKLINEIIETNNNLNFLHNKKICFQNLKNYKTCDSCLNLNVLNINYNCGHEVCFNCYNPNLNNCVNCKSFNSKNNLTNKIKLFLKLKNNKKCCICFNEKLHINLNCGHELCVDCYNNIADDYCIYHYCKRDTKNK